MEKSKSYGHVPVSQMDHPCRVGYGRLTLLYRPKALAAQFLSKALGFEHGVISLLGI